MAQNIADNNSTIQLNGEALPGEDQDARVALALMRGVCRALTEAGSEAICEFTLANGRRADVLALGRSGEIALVEVKSSVTDFRSDQKWPEYLDYCDRFYFAVAADFPLELLPEDCGIMVADAYGAAILREAPERGLHNSRRRALTLAFARTAAQRLSRFVDPRES